MGKSPCHNLGLHLCHEISADFVGQKSPQIIKTRDQAPLISVFRGFMICMRKANVLQLKQLRLISHGPFLYNGVGICDLGYMRRVRLFSCAYIIMITYPSWVLDTLETYMSLFMSINHLRLGCQMRNFKILEENYFLFLKNLVIKRALKKVGCAITL